MSQSNNTKYTASGAIPKGAACKITSAGVVAVTTAATERVAGFAFNEAADGEPVVLMVDGHIPALSNGSGTAIAAGDQLSPGAGGKVVKYAGTATHRNIGTALEVSTENGRIISIVFDAVQQIAAS